MSEQNKLAIFITGATTGLGREAAKKCIDLGHKVIITGRTEDKLKAANHWILKDSPQFKDNLYNLQLDLGNLKSIKESVDKFETFQLPVIDVLVNNAGGTASQFTQVDGQIESTIFMNAVAPIYLTELLLPFIKNSQERRILFVASSLHDRETKGGGSSEAATIPENVTMDDIAGSKDRWDSMRYYRLSKLACVWDTYELASQHSDVTITTFCPGFVPTTDLARRSGFVLRMMMKYVISRMSFATTEEKATDDYVYYITSPDIKTSSYYQNRNVSTSSKESLDETKRKAYWELATKVIDNMK